MTGDQLRAWLARHGITDRDRTAGPIELFLSVRPSDAGAMARVTVIRRDEGGGPLIDYERKEVLTETRVVPFDIEEDIR